MSRMDNTTATPAKEKTPPSVTPDERRIDSKSLLGNEGRVIIEHDGQHYLLRQTHAGKLILTK
ncbi:TPA: hemin uptake protein HemP [Citrobacter pasteurii]|uniref:hemin uptake protein HemP n=1 Tax=unclassified Citrobacter TaxID=2644389 RepID=UPI001A2B75BC|nr:MULTISPECIES: hemin uptake protein HemP [unclassified Citrobacter]EKU7609612.1 hemin uptake protein HemP [Citrobacter freundii]MBJ3558666.1 hemin uptake protein HemP [Salmonella enterica subsp. enterica serovar Derby]MBJ4955924.1 hemin uptake protein HemP [Salmonella enterica subsp. enterica serovar Goldcoast]MDA8504243.1 hemin uptake protein HemP [Citrobacter sp. Awk 2]MDA8511468.1 hemin uptake protein HemP [Citrobacter sp. Igbk 14]